MDNEYIGEVLECIDDLLTEANAFNKLVDKQAKDDLDYNKRNADIDNTLMSGHSVGLDKLKQNDQQNREYDDRRLERGFSCYDNKVFKKYNNPVDKGKTKSNYDGSDVDINRFFKQNWMKKHGNNGKSPEEALEANRYLKKQHEKTLKKAEKNASSKIETTKKLSKEIADTKNPIAKAILKYGMRKSQKAAHDSIMKRGAEQDELNKVRKESVEDCYDLDDLKLRTYESFRNGLIEESTANDILELLDVIETCVCD